MGAMIGIAAAALVGAIGGVAVVGPVAAERFTAESSEAEEHGEEEKAAVESYSVENLVLNPAETNGTRFLMATVVATVTGDHAASTMKERDAEIRDRLMSLLSSKTVNELADVTRRDTLKGEIRAVLSELGSHHDVKVKAVYLPTFVIQ